MLFFLRIRHDVLLETVLKLARMGTLEASGTHCENSDDPWFVAELPVATLAGVRLLLELGDSLRDVREVRTCAEGAMMARQRTLFS